MFSVGAIDNDLAVERVLEEEIKRHLAKERDNEWLNCIMNG